MSDASIRCWGAATPFDLREAPTRATSQALAQDKAAGAVSAGESCVCAILRGENTVRCWGHVPLYVEDGAQKWTSNRAFVDVVIPRVFNLAATGANSICATTTTGEAYCWGRGSPGIDETKPTVLRVPLVSKLEMVSTGIAEDCGLDEKGSVWCWEHTRGAVPKPKRVALASPAASISASGLHACAILRDEHTVACWGHNDAGQLGNGSTIDSPAPVVVQGLDSGAMMLSVGRNHTCALVRQAVWCWGNNRYGQLGDGTVDDRPMPVRVPLDGAAIAVAAGGAHTCALLATRSIFCWGRNATGELGDGTLVSHTSPLRLRTAVD